MALTISVLEDAFQFVGEGYKGESFAFINRESGDCYFLSNVIDTEDQELPDGYETRADFDADDRFISMPHKSDLDLGKRLNYDFAREFMPEEEDAVYAIFRNKGAYKRYRSLLETKDLRDEWYKFEREQNLVVLRKWSADNGIELVD